MPPVTARDIAKSVGTWSWALSVFAAQEAWNIITGSQVQDTLEAIDQVNRSMKCGCAGARRLERLEQVETEFSEGSEPEVPGWMLTARWFGGEGAQAMSSVQ